MKNFFWRSNYFQAQTTFLHFLAGLPSCFTPGPELFLNGSVYSAVNCIPQSNLSLCCLISISFNSSFRAKVCLQMLKTELRKYICRNFTVQVLVTSSVDGDALSGICYVGNRDLVNLNRFVCGPLIVYLSLGGFFLFLGFINLFRIRTSIKKVTT